MLSRPALTPRLHSFFYKNPEIIKCHFKSENKTASSNNKIIRRLNEGSATFFHVSNRKHQTDIQSVGNFWGESNF